MVQCYQSQGQWDNRAYPRVHGAFADLFGTEELWTSFDMLHMKPPAHPRGEGDPGFGVDTTACKRLFSLGCVARADGACAPVHWDLGMPHLRQGMHLASPTLSSGREKTLGSGRKLSVGPQTLRLRT